MAFLGVVLDIALVKVLAVADGKLEWEISIVEPPTSIHME